MQTGAGRGGGVGAVRLGAVAVGAVHAERAVSQLLGEHRAELERRTQLHVHGAGQVVLAEQRQRRAVDGLFPKTLQQRKHDTLLTVAIITLVL